MIHTTVVAILLSVSPVALGQTLSFGVVTGTNLTQDFRIPSWSRSTPGSRGVIAGPAIEIALPGSLWVELNALHRSLRYNYEVLIFGGSQFALKVNVDTWEFPLLVKYRFPISTDGRLSNWVLPSAPRTTRAVRSHRITASPAAPELRCIRGA